MQHFVIRHSAFGLVSSFGFRHSDFLMWTPWYTAIMGLAILTGALVSRFTQRELRLQRYERLGIAIGAFVGAMLGAKLPFVLADWEGLVSGRAWFGDGKTILFGLAGGYLGVVVAKWALEIRTRTGDSFAVPVAAAIAVGRLACFVGRCCYGTPTSLPWGVVFATVDSQPRHPTQLYEFVFHLVAAAILWWLQTLGLFRGHLIKIYILAYLAYRFASEFIRPEARLWANLTGYQWAAMALAVVFAAIWCRDARRMALERAVP
jgi:phosphatidylglycerol:prolipoprotein diacylglycerol transferase